MTDDVKTTLWGAAAKNGFRYWVGAGWSKARATDYLRQQLGGDEHAAMMLLVHYIDALEAHLESEPERIAAAREERREADARHTYSGAFVSDSTTLRWELDGAVLGEREAWRQTDEMRRQRDEAVAALRFVRGCRSACACHEHARAVLAKYPEVKP